MGPDGPFSGWVRSGVQWQNFDVDGTKYHDKRDEIQDSADEDNYLE